jgi:hypothetical protein
MTEPVPGREHALAEQATTGASGAPEQHTGGESTGTVVVAGLANFGIAIAKLIGGLISHSRAMLREGPHWVP